MGEFGFQPKRITLMSGKLTLDPAIVAMMSKLEADMATRKILADMLQPNWRLLLPDFQSMLASPPPNLLTMPSPPSGVPVPYPNMYGPATPPRAGELSEVAGAIYKLPAIQGLVTRAHDEGLRQVRVLQREWETAPISEKVVMVTMTTLVVGAFITPIVANQKTRDLAFGFIKGRDLSVPGVDGLSFTILDRGGAITVPLGVPGLSGSARLQLPNSAAPSYEATITFDVMEFIKSR